MANFPSQYKHSFYLFVNVNKAAVYSKVVVLLLLNHCLLLLPLFVAVPCFVNVLLFSMLCPSRFAAILMREQIDLL